MNKIKKEKNKIVKWSILTGVFAVLVVASQIGGDFAFNNGASAINMALGTSDYKTISQEDAEPATFFETDYEFMMGDNKYSATAGQKLFEEDSKSVENAEAEGAVLLWNKNEALPLSQSDSKVSLLSHSSVDIVECGSGSGYIKTTMLKKGTSISISLKDAFESRGYTVNPTLWDFYATGAGSSYKRTSPETACTQWRVWEINECPWSKYNESVKNSFASYGDVAFLVLSRTGGEYSDLHYNYSSEGDYVGKNDSGSGENTSAEGGVLGLTQEEKDLYAQVSALRENGTFKKVVLLMNTPNPVMFKHIAPYYDNIDAAMWIGQPGTSGLYSVVDLLKGKNKNNEDLIPSGHLPDTFMYDLNSAPASVNDSNNRYGNHALLGDDALTADNNLYNTYQIYAENIYVGYKYYETRYEDTFIGNRNASSSAGAKCDTTWKYEKEVAFPFGYGESYTNFTYSDYSATRSEDGKNFEVKVKVTNSGTKYSGKEVVQVYLQKPYTQFDIDHKIEKSSIELAGYAKTNTLQPGASEEVVINVPYEYFKTYDAEVNQTYIVESGDYYLTLGTDSHTALNNVMMAKQLSMSDLTTSYFGNYQKNNKTNLNKDFVTKFTLDEDLTTFSKSTQTGEEITNQFDESDINKYSNRGNNKATYLSRSNWEATYPVKPTDESPLLTLNAAMVKDLRRDVEPDDEGYKKPTYSKFASGSKTGINNVSAGDVNAFMMIGAPLYPEKGDPDEVVNGKTNKEWADLWNQLMDQTSFEEQSLLCSDAYHRFCGAVSISLPESKQENGPVGITRRGDFPVPNSENISEYYYVCYPCAGILAASFNKDVAIDVGKHKSEDMLYCGYNGIYGPGANMHRSPFSGRAYEYPSEDSLLAGLSAYYESNGIESKGCMAFAKHYAMNDSETNRRHVGTWCSEQATREIYLRTFEIAFAEGGASATMNAFSRIGTKWAGGCYSLATAVLRDEWGWTGVNITDWASGGPMSYVDAICAGTNSFDGNGSETKYSQWKSNNKVCQALRESSRVIIYNIIKTNAMNGLDVSSTVIAITPWWRAAIRAIQGIFITLTGYSGVMLAVNIVYKKINKKNDGNVETEKEANV